MKRILTLTTAALLLLGTAAIAQPGDGPHAGRPGRMAMKHRMGMERRMHQGMMHRDGAGHLLMMAEELKLTDQQIDKLETMMSDFRSQQIDRQAAVKKARLRLSDLQRKDNSAETDVLRAIDEHARLRADIAKARYQHMRTMHNVLTTEQQAELKEMRFERMHRFWDDDDDEDEFEAPEAPEPSEAPRAPRGNN
jgi:Spy/CpxP family protein refolding chaperone